MNQYTVVVEFTLHADSAEAAAKVIEAQLEVGTYVGHITDVEGGDTPEPCMSPYTTGGADPYDTECDRPEGHDGPHEGPHPMAFDNDPTRIRWEGGGYCEGDPLPTHHVQTIRPGDLCLDGSVVEYR